jgi:hypothetical protein
MEAMIPCCMVYYGSDYSDQLYVFGPAEREELLAYSRGPHGNDYHEAKK